MIDAMHIIGNIFAIERKDDLHTAFMKDVRKLIDSVQPTHCLVCFDDLSRNWRRTLGQHYSQRGYKLPMALRLQSMSLAKTLRNNGIQSVCKSTMEARDIINSVKTRLESLDDFAELEIIVVAGGKRYHSIVSEKTSLYSPYNRGKAPSKKTAQVISEVYGGTGKRVVEFLALAGDKDTNISGVTGIGEKKALELLNEYGTLRTIHTHKAMVDGAIGEKLRAGLQPNGECITSYKLLSAKTDVSIGMNFSQLQVQTVMQAA